MTKPLILAYGLSTEQKEALTETIEGKVKYLEPTEDELHQRVGFIAGLTGYEREELFPQNYPLDMNFLLFCFIPQNDLYEILTDLKNKGHIFPYKAVLTDTTKDWQFSFLLNHIVDEHILVQTYNKLGGLVAQAQEYIKTHPNKDIEDTIQKAKDLPQIYGEDLTVEIIHEIHERLKQQITS